MSIFIGFASAYIRGDTITHLHEEMITSDIWRLTIYTERPAKIYTQTYKSYEDLVDEQDSILSLIDDTK